VLEREAEVERADSSASIWAMASSTAASWPGCTRAGLRDLESRDRSSCRSRHRRYVARNGTPGEQSRHPLRRRHRSLHARALKQHGRLEHFCSLAESLISDMESVSFSSLAPVRRPGWRLQLLGALPKACRALRTDLDGGEIARAGGALRSDRIKPWPRTERLCFLHWSRARPS